MRFNGIRHITGITADTPRNLDESLGERLMLPEHREPMRAELERSLTPLPGSVDIGESRAGAWEPDAV